jgi:hypothetical protein
MERQYVGIDLHCRRSTSVRMDEAGEALTAVNLDNDPIALEVAKAGPDPELAVEATYGWYWLVDALQDAGANVRLAHSLGVRMYQHQRVKNDRRDAAHLAHLLRMGRLSEAWIAPPATRELRELVRRVADRAALPGPCDPRQGGSDRPDERPLRGAGHPAARGARTRPGV